jgi:hypothetical protein
VVRQSAQWSMHGCMDAGCMRIWATAVPAAQDVVAGLLSMMSMDAAAFAVRVGCCGGGSTTQGYEPAASSHFQASTVLQRTATQMTFDDGNGSCRVCSEL